MLRGEGWASIVFLVPKLGLIMRIFKKKYPERSMNLYIVFEKFYED